MAPSRSTLRMMQATRAAFQAVANLNEQATDPKSHTLVRPFYTRTSAFPLPAIPMVDPESDGHFGSLCLIQSLISRFQKESPGVSWKMQFYTILRQERIVTGLHSQHRITDTHFIKNGVPQKGSHRHLALWKP